MTFYSNFSDLDGKRYEIEIHSDGGGEEDIVKKQDGYAEE